MVRTMTGSRAVSRALLLIVMLSGAGIAACGGGGGENTVAPAEWRMVLAHRGGSTVIPLDAMNVFLVEDESYPEYFSIEGGGVVLGGDFPAGLHVGYEEDWKVLFGKAIVLSPRGGDPASPQESFVELSEGVRSRVTGGSIVFEKLSGKFSGSEGDFTLSGRIMLVVQTGSGLETLLGTIAVHCITWG